MPKDAAAAAPDPRDTDLPPCPESDTALSDTAVHFPVVAEVAPLPAVRTMPLACGTAAWISAVNPIKSTPNEDAVAALPLGTGQGLLLVADGLGGHRGGRTASQLLRKQITRLARRLDQPQAARPLLISGVIPIPMPAPTDDPRSLILDEIERVNQRLLRSRLGSASTLALVEVHGQRVRTYHIGDSEILILSQRGRLKFASVSHSPIGYAVESGMLAGEDALFHPDRHLVSNVVGSERMSIELGRWITLSPRDTVLLASDGLFDNLHQEEIVEVIRKGPLAAGVEQLARFARHRMSQAEQGVPSKPDDLTILCYRGMG